MPLNAKSPFFYGLLFIALILADRTGPLVAAVCC
jgi:hypothetical protein